MENEKEILSNVSDATLEQPVEITVDIHPVNVLHGKLQEWGILPKQRVFQMKPIRLGSLIRISKLLLAIELRVPGDRSSGQESLLQVNYEAIAKHTVDMARIIVIALQNHKEEPGKRLVDFVLRNFTPKEMASVLVLVLQQMDLTNFMRSIISIKGLNALNSGNHAPANSANGSGVSL